MSLLSVHVAVLRRSVLLLCLLWLLLAGVGGKFCFLVANVEAGAPSYVYDDAGRLTAVIDPTEVRRILLLQANETCVRYGIAGVKPVRKEESTGAESTAPAQ